MCKNNNWIWYYPDLTYCAIELRKNPTKAEHMLWQRLKGRQMKGYRFNRQKPLLHYIVDFYCSKLKLAIEVEGSIHEREDVAYRDAIRLGELGEYGIKVLQFSNYEVFRDIRKVIWDIEDWIEKNR
jgi:very-short-patch-repair endonuclease